MSNLRQVILTATISCVATALTLMLVHSYVQQSKVKRIRDEFAVPDWSTLDLTSDNEPKAEAELILNEQLTRTLAFLGPEPSLKLRSSFIIVIGLGGVGSHAVTMLLRSGVQRIRLVDFDQVTLSSLNRHAVATRADVGLSKVVVVKNHLNRIIPSAQIEACVELFSASSASRLLADKPDFVLAELIHYCSVNGLRVISSMGAGAKSDASRIQIGDISETFEDPLARATRRILKQMGCNSLVPVVYSTEKPGDVKLLPLPEEKFQDREQYSALPTFRSRILPVLGTIPAMFGNAMASYVLTELAGLQTNPLAIQSCRKIIERLHCELILSERKHLGEEFDLINCSCPIKFNKNDIRMIYEDVWNSRSALSGSVNDKLTLVRWDSDCPAVFGNIICLTRKEALVHGKMAKSDWESQYTSVFLGFVQKRFEREVGLLKWRDALLL